MFTLKDIILNNIEIAYDTIKNEGAEIAKVYWFDYGCIIVIDQEKNISPTDKDIKIIRDLMDKLQSFTDNEKLIRTMDEYPLVRTPAIRISWDKNINCKTNPLGVFTCNLSSLPNESILREYLLEKYGG